MATLIAHPRDILPSSPSDERRATFYKNLNKLPCLVDLENAKRHLLLLGAFHTQLEKIEPFKGGAEPTDALRTFLTRGIHRFHLWLTYVIGQSSERDGIQPKELPPVDVLMLYHAYVLRPHRFYEAGVTTYPQFVAIGKFPLQLITPLIDPATHEYTPNTEQQQHWERCTGTAFSPMAYANDVKTVQIKCPFCSAATDVLWQNNGHGYGEREFLHECSSCHAKVNHDKLCVAIFLAESKSVTESETAIISGTLLDNCGQICLPRARLIALEVVKALQNDDGSLPALEETSIHDVATKLSDAPSSKLRSDRILFLLRPFTQPTAFRQDLARAVFLLRQMNADLWANGMCSESYLSGPCTQLAEGYSRYVIFLEMAAFPEKGRIVPTPDVDLIWHTHQLEGLGYRDTIISLFGVYLDHMSMEEDNNAHDIAVRNSNSRLKEIFAARFNSPAPLMTKSCHACGGKGCTKCCCGPSMTQDFLVDEVLQGGADIAEPCSGCS